MPPTASDGGGDAVAGAPPAAADPLDLRGPPDALCINCWSGPRCCSTSLMYSFAQRADTAVADEPLYASFLSKTGADRPYRAKVLAAQSSDAAAVVHDVLRLGQPRGGGGGGSGGSATTSRRIVFAKHMSKHKVGVPQALWSRAAHVLLVRDPAAVLLSFARVLPPTLHELGYTSLLEIASELRAAGRPPPAVVLSDDLARRPEATLRALCAALNLPFDRAMLSWPAGPKPYDGPWADWWYGGTHRSTCFDVGVREARGEPLPDALKPLLGECWPAYESLRAMALRPLPLGGGGGLLGGGRGGGGSSAGAVVPRPLLPLGPAAEAAETGPPRPHNNTSNNNHVSTHSFAVDPRNKDVLVGVRDGALPSHRPSARGPPPAEGSSAALLAAASAPPFDLVWRPQARVSVLDSAFMLGDGLWEGLRCRDGVVLFARQHLDRLWEGLRAFDFRGLGVTRAQLLALVHATLDANTGMGLPQPSSFSSSSLSRGGGVAAGATPSSPSSPSPLQPSSSSSGHVHVRLMVSRGLKSTPYQDPAVTLGLPTIVCLPEWKKPLPQPYRRGIRLATVHVRRGAPDAQDPSLNTHSKLNCIAACAAAKKAGADEALMLDPRGFVATCNSTNFFIVVQPGAWGGCSGQGGGGQGGGGQGGGVELWTAPPGHLRRGVTRENVLRLARALPPPALRALPGGLVVREREFSLAEVYSAQEAFVTGTFGGIVPVRSVDGHAIGDWRKEEGEAAEEDDGGGRGAGSAAAAADEEEGDDGEAEGGLPALLAGDAAGPVTRALAQAYADLCAAEAAAGRAAAMASVADGGGGGGARKGARSGGGGGGGGAR